MTHTQSSHLIYITPQKDPSSCEKELSSQRLRIRGEAMVEQPQMKKVFAFCIVLEMNSFTTLFYVNTLHKEKRVEVTKKRTVNLLFFSTFMTSKSQIDFISFVLLLFFKAARKPFRSNVCIGFQSISSLVVFVLLSAFFPSKNLKF